MEDGRWAADIGVSGPLASDLADDFQSYQDASDKVGQADLLSYEREQFNPVLDPRPHLSFRCITGDRIRTGQAVAADRTR